MAQMRKVKTKTKYEVRDAKCIGRKCLVLGMYQHRSMLAGGGSRNTGGVTACCMTRMFSGCPSGDAEKIDTGLAKERKAEGWRVV